MKLLITAPIRLRFTLNSSQTAFKNEEFFHFWDRVKKGNYSDDNFDKIIYYKAKKQNSEDQSYDDSSRTDLSLLGIDTLKLSNGILQLLQKENSFAKNFFDLITKSEIKIYDNTVAIFDLRINLRKLSEREEEFTKECEEKVKQIIKNILLKISNSLNCFFEFLQKEDNNNIIQDLNSEQEYNDFVDFFREDKNIQIMWASCALKYEKGDNNFKLLDHWLKDAIEEEKIKHIQSNSNAFSLDWLKYAFREDVENYEELWETMFLAQYYYSVIEVIIYNLKLIINESYKINGKSKSISTLLGKNRIVLVNQKLEAISETSYLHIVEYKDVKKYLKRNRLEIFNQILDAWTFNDLIDNTQDLLSTVKDRVDLIYNKISTRNNFYTDILLTFIGFFAIIDLVLSFSQYSREYTADAMISSRGNDENSILYYLSTIPIDTFIGSGFFISIVLLVVYFIYRKKILP
jgi:hypothetical protein